MYTWLMTYPRDRDRWRNGIRKGCVVFYGHDHIPGHSEMASGGIVKCQDLQKIFMNTPQGASILYLVSSALPAFPERLVKYARKAGAKLIWNQNGVAIEAYHGNNTEAMNGVRRRLLLNADYAVYQSRFCVESSDRYLGKRNSNWEVLYNPVDTGYFLPKQPILSGKRPVLIMGGSHHHRYRITSALKGVHELKRRGVAVLLRIIGRLVWGKDSGENALEINELTDQLGIVDQVEVLGTYPQEDAPKLLKAADVLLHTKYMDPCPRLVVEAMSCGLPVIHLKSGGVPELVGEDAGVGVAVPEDWHNIHEMDPVSLADAVEKIVDNYRTYSEAARQRCIDKFDIKPWIIRHKEIFEGVHGT